jgi:hypothetical protein
MFFVAGKIKFGTKIQKMSLVWEHLVQKKAPWNKGL